MPAEHNLEALQGLLRDCTALVKGSKGGSGTGFFIDSDLLLTCAHVAEGDVGDVVTVYPTVGGHREGRILEIVHDELEDIALVEVTPNKGDPRQPAVAITQTAVEDDKVSHYGYPRGSLDKRPDIEFKTYTVNARGLGSEMGVTRWIVHAGQERIRFGQSGGALLSHRLGAVVGLMQFSDDPNGNSGGGGIPISRIVRKFEAVRKPTLSPPTATAKWRAALGRESWEAFGWTWGSEETLDLEISGGPSSWTVTFSSEDDIVGKMCGNALPENISEALFAWAQSKRLKQKEDLELLGSLLGAALLPKQVLERLRASFGNDHLLIRLHFEENSALSDVPWEYAALALEKEQVPIGVCKKVSFVRVAEADGQSISPAVPPETDPKPPAVLAITIAPEDWKSVMPKRRNNRSLIDWPPYSELSAELKRSVARCRNYKLLPLENPQLDELQDKLEGLSELNVDIVHYTGFGNFENGKARLALSNGAAGAQTLAFAEFCRTLKLVDPRLLVLQFLLPPNDVEYEPIPPSALQEAIGGKLNAIVYNRSYLHPRQTNAFNVRFYERLGEGKTIERAVQLARRSLQVNRPMNDPACFGAFTLLTGPTSHMRFGSAQESIEQVQSDREESPRLPSQRPK